MEIVDTLNKTLLIGNCEKDKGCTMDIEIYKNMAWSYAQVENSIAVLSDMQADKSYVYFSRTADELGLNSSENPKVIDSIWEEDILKKFIRMISLKNIFTSCVFLKCWKR
uniref:Uncharacterized protein n=1 Tax=Chryseobacterium endophyticum TaxID=1854762 RepID=A0AAU6WM20_9FLAO